MKLLLTSGGLTNNSITKALLKLIAKPFSKANLLFIPTAANVEENDKWWLIKDLELFNNLNLKNIDIVDISAVPQDIWRPRLEHADVLVFGGGNTYHLMYWLEKSGLKSLLPEMLKTKIYVGISAGSMVTSNKLLLSESPRFYSQELGKYKGTEGLGHVSFNIRPHLNSPDFPAIRIKKLAIRAKTISETIYAIDDQTAIQVIDGSVTVVSEGDWKKFN